MKKREKQATNTKATGSVKKMLSRIEDELELWWKGRKVLLFYIQLLRINKELFRIH